MAPIPDILVEACVDSVVSAESAVAGGAERLELCGGLVEGGITPSAGMIAQVWERVDVAIHVLIRPRGGDFLYDEDELRVMLDDIAVAGQSGVEGVVIGALTADGRIDEQVTRRLMDAARPMAVTFHRAFDLARDPDEALDVLMALGVERVLTSGQAATAEAGIPLIRAMVQQSAGRIVILAGGGIDEGNAARIIYDTGVREIHVRGSRTAESRMQFRRDGVYMGKAYAPDEYRRVEVDPGRIAKIVRSARGAS
jgi:copper homeostasis protein